MCKHTSVSYDYCNKKTYNKYQHPNVKYKNGSHLLAAYIYCTLQSIFALGSFVFNFSFTFYI